MCGKMAGLYHRGAYFNSAFLAFVLVVGLCLLCIAQPVLATVVWSGNIAPDNPTTWDMDTIGHIGYSASGTMSITDGGTVSNGRASIGVRDGATGEVAVDGAGSIWINSEILAVGDSGSGTLNITNGGMVNNLHGSIAQRPGSTGEVTVDGVGSTLTNSGVFTVGLYGNGSLNVTGGGVVTVEEETTIALYADSMGKIHFDSGTLTTGGLCCAPDDLTGTGTINTHGLVSDIDVIFDATHGMNQTFTINEDPGQYVTINLTVNGSALMGAGYGGVGTIRICDGTSVGSPDGCIGYKCGSTGTATVNGLDSTWEINRKLRVGYFGSGALNITDVRTRFAIGMIQSQTGSPSRTQLMGGIIFFGILPKATWPGIHC